MSFHRNQAEHLKFIMSYKPTGEEVDMAQDRILLELKKTAIFKYLGLLHDSGTYSPRELFDAFSFIAELKIIEEHPTISDNDIANLTEKLFRTQTGIQQHNY